MLPISRRFNRPKERDGTYVAMYIEPEAATRVNQLTSSDDRVQGGLGIRCLYGRDNSEQANTSPALGWTSVHDHDDWLFDQGYHV
jgi:hypothetical protein